MANPMTISKCLIIGSVLAAIATVGLVVFWLAGSPAGKQTKHTLAQSSGRGGLVADENTTRTISPELSEAARKVPLGQLRRSAGSVQGGGSVPPTEELRIAAFGSMLAEAAHQVPLAKLNSFLESDFPSEAGYFIHDNMEGSRGLRWRRLSPSHVEVSLNNTDKYLCSWFIFRVDHAKGKRIRFDLKNPHIDNWETLNPVWISGEALDLEPFALSPVSRGLDDVSARGWNGPLLPPLEKGGGGWAYIEDVWREDPKSLSFVHQFDSDVTYIAMRPPRLATYNEDFARRVSARSGQSDPVIVHKLARTKGDNDLLIYQIGHARKLDGKPSQCIVVYAGEHGDEHDAMWVAHGVIESFLQRSGTTLKDQGVVALVIPTMDPDGTAVGAHGVMTTTFAEHNMTMESTVYADWFRRWVDQGNRVDLVFNIHNVQSREAGHVACALVESLGVRGKASLAFHGKFVESLKQHGYDAAANPWAYGFSPHRLGGWLVSNYGAACFAYEVNSQAPRRHLNNMEVRQIGSLIATQSIRFLQSPDAAPLISDIDQRRLARDNRMKLKPDLYPNDMNAIVYEAKLKK